MAPNKVAQAHLHLATARVRVGWQAKEGVSGPGRVPFVPYVGAGEVRRVLRESVALGVIDDWSAEYQLLEGGLAPRGGERVYALCRLRIEVEGRALYRQEVGRGQDPVAACADAFVRAALCYGVGAVLEGLEEVLVEVDAFGHPRPEEWSRLQGMVEQAYRDLLARLKGERGEELAPSGQAPQAPLLEPLPETAPGPRGDGVARLLEDMATADEYIGGLVDRLGQKVEAVRLLARYGWKREIFSGHKRGEVSMDEIKAFLEDFLGKPVLSLEEALVQAREKARALYRELSALQRTKGA